MATRAESNRIYARVSGDLTQRIAQGEFDIGMRLPPERELALAYRVSRPTVREAIIALEVDGLVEVRQGSGVYVIARHPRSGNAGITDVGPFELLEARRAIEGEAAALAATHITADEVARLRAYVDEMGDTNLQDDIVKSERIDGDFHLLIATASRNSAMYSAVENLWNARVQSPQSRMLSQKAHAAGVKPRIDEHVAIVEALRAHDVDQARWVMKAHLTRVLDTLFEMTEVQEIEQARERLAEQRRRFSRTT